MGFLVRRLFLRWSSSGCRNFRWLRGQGICLYLLTLLASVVNSQTDSVIYTTMVDYTTVFIPNSTIELLSTTASIPEPLASASALPKMSSLDLAPSMTLNPSSSQLDTTQLAMTDFSDYTSFYDSVEVTTEMVVASEALSTITTSVDFTMLKTSVMLQSSVVLQPSSIVSTIEMGRTSSVLGSPISGTMLESPTPSSYEQVLPMSTPAVETTSLVQMPITLEPSASPSPLYSSPSVMSYMPVPSSSSMIIATSQSLSPTPISSTPSPTLDSSSQSTVTTAGPDQLSILEWFGIAVGGAAVLFVLFLLFHCYQLKQRAVRKQKKEMKKEFLDFSQSNRNDRISSWRNSLALDAMATHIELPQEDGMDMQATDNLGFEEVFLGDEPKLSPNNNYFLPQTNL